MDTQADHGLHLQQREGQLPLAGYSYVNLQLYQWIARCFSKKTSPPKYIYCFMNIPDGRKLKLLDMQSAELYYIMPHVVPPFFLLSICNFMSGQHRLNGRTDIQSVGSSLWLRLNYDLICEILSDHWNYVAETLIMLRRCAARKFQLVVRIEVKLVTLRFIIKCGKFLFCKHVLKLLKVPIIEIFRWNNIIRW